MYIVFEKENKTVAGMASLEHNDNGLVSFEITKEEERHPLNSFIPKVENGKIIGFVIQND